MLLYFFLIPNALSVHSFSWGSGTGQNACPINAKSKNKIAINPIMTFYLYKYMDFTSVRTLKLHLSKYQNVIFANPTFSVVCPANLPATPCRQSVITKIRFVSYMPGKFKGYLTLISSSSLSKAL